MPFQKLWSTTDIQIQIRKSNNVISIQWQRHNYSQHINPAPTHLIFTVWLKTIEYFVNDKQLIVLGFNFINILNGK